MRNGAPAATLLALAAATLALPTAACAHALLQRAEPSVGSTVRSPPVQVELTFTEAVEPRFSTISVADPAGRQVDRQDVHLGSGDARHLAVSLDPLPPGVFTVRWHATSVDTHRTEGSFTFTVAP